MLPSADDFLDPIRPPEWAYDKPPKQGVAPTKQPIRDKPEPRPPVAEDSKAICG